MYDPQKLTNLEKPRLSVVLNNMSLSQKILEVQNMQKDADFNIFYLNNSKHEVNLGCTMPVHNLWSVWNSVIVCSEWIEAEYVSKVTTKNTKIFYIYDIDWHAQPLDFLQQQDILASMDKILCRCVDHKLLIKQHFGYDASVMENFDYDFLMGNDK